MSDEKISCRIAIQVCVGHFPDGRKRHRTFSLKGIRPDASWEGIKGIIRALSPVLAFPITKVTKVTKKVLFSAEEERDVARRDVGDAVPRVAMPTPQVDVGPVPAEGRIIPLPFSRVTEHPAVHWAVACDIAKPSSFASLKKKSFMSDRAPPARSRPVSKQSGSPGYCLAV